MSRGTIQEMLGVLRGIQLVAEASIREHTRISKEIWSNSSIREAIEQNLSETTKYAEQTAANPAAEFKKIGSVLQEVQERTSVVTEGLRQLIAAKASLELKMSHQNIQNSSNKNNELKDIKYAATAAATASSSPSAGIGAIDAANMDISSITLKELESILSKRHQDREINLRTAATKTKQVPQEETSQKPTMETLNAASSSVPLSAIYNDTPQVPTLSKVAKQRSVPSSRIARLASFGSLFAGLGVGTISEMTKGALGLGGSKNMQEAFLSPANADRIVDTLCKVRGAALKIGQMLSIQDSNIVSPQLAKAFERVRQAADYMPDWQVERVMNTQLGPEWRQLLKSFDDKPFAAASIGQVHRATLLNDMIVAIKIQYPGVAKSIESDIDNLVGMLKVWDVFPKGLFIDNVVRVAKREFAWEVDYTREAEYTEQYKKMIAPYQEYYVPFVVRELTTPNVLTTELVPGVPLDKCFEMSYDHRKHIGAAVLKLCLRELFEIQCMQTDPNWSNFLYDAATRRVMLIDFGSTRFYDKQFIKKYREIIMCAANNNRQGVLELSREMGFLTGYENKQMEEAHLDAVMIMGEMFRYDGEFNFGNQNTTERIASLVPTMTAHRLCPPPEEIYSIHRKLAGIFLLLSRLNVKLNCREFYEEIVIGNFKE